MTLPIATDESPTRGASPEPGWYGADPYDAHQAFDPYTGFRKLREAQPVNLTPDGHWRLTRYDDVVRLLRGVRAGMRRTDGSIPGQDPVQAQTGQPSFMLLQDPPTHTRLRKLVSKAFTPRAVESWRPRIETISEELLDRVAARGQMDLIADFALPLPATLICELMGVPVEDRDRFTTWTADATHGLAVVRGVSDPELVARVERARSGLAGYFNALIEERRKQPRGDLLSVLIAAEEDGDKLTPGELLVQAIGLLIAGFETTIGLIGNGVSTLLRNPAELAKLRANPGLIVGVVEECLRYSGPILSTVRVLHEDARFGDFVIPANSEVFAVLAAANRDPAHFALPERFDVERYTRQPACPPHLSFGGGVHLCLGAHLARLESQIAIAALVRRLDDLALVDERTEWGRSLFRVPARVPLTFCERAA